MGNQKREILIRKILVSLLFFLILAVLASPAYFILKARLEWNVVFDIQWLQKFHTTAPSLFTFLRDFLAGERIHGMYRPIYGIWVYLVYGVLGTGWHIESKPLYASCYLLHLVTALGYALSFTREPRARVAAFLIYLAFLPSVASIYLIFLPERMALFFGMLALYFSTRRVWLTYPFLALAVLTTPFALILSAPILAVTRRRGFAVFGFLCAIAIVGVAKSAGAENVAIPYSWAILTPLLAGIAAWVFSFTGQRFVQNLLLALTLMATAFALGPNLNYYLGASVASHEVGMWLRSPISIPLDAKVYFPPGCEEVVSSLAFMSKRPSENFQILHSEGQFNAQRTLFGTYTECPELPVIPEHPYALVREIGDWKFYRVL